MRAAIAGGIVLAVAAIALSFAARWQLALVIGGYFVLTVTYSLWLKHEPVLDLACGRVRASCCARSRAVSRSASPISPWFLIVAGAGSLFMVTGKRSAELRQLGAGAVSHRRSLDGYTESVPELRARGRVERRDPRVLPVGVREVGRPSASRPGSSSRSCRSCSASCATRCCSTQGDGGAPEELVLSDRVLLGLGVGVGGVLRDRGARWLTDRRATRNEVLTGWGRTAPTRATRARAPPHATTSSALRRPRAERARA